MTDIFDLGLEPHPPKPPLRRRLLQIPAIAVSLALIVAIVVGGVSLAGKLVHPSEPNDWVGDGTGSVLVEVHPGDSITEIGHTLAAAGVVKSATAFVDAAQANDQS
ncbi:MAG: hypothetical protein K6T28_00585, partial [Acidothermus sp.]|nr:hypothetical protein [Acidothermus sp.]